MKPARMSANQRRYLEYVMEHQGCCIADVNAACRRNPQAGHRWVYDGVARLVKRGILLSERDGAKTRLFTPCSPDGRALLAKRRILGVTLEVA
jgi:hypothetical protein